MKRLAAIILGLWCGSAVSQEAPFAPLPSVPDYVVTFAAKPGSSRIVTHHSGWVRIESTVANQPYMTTYARISEPLTITVRQEPRSLEIRRGAEAHRSYGWNDEAFKTEGQDVILGEPCDIWNVGRSTIDISPTTKSTLARFSCISRDGIELRNWFSRYNSSGEPTGIERRPVQAQDVLPPTELFQLKTWLTEPAAVESNRPGDATVIMEAQRPGTHPNAVKARIVRRHHSWTRSEDVYVGGQRKGTITNDSERLTVSFEVNPDGQFTSLNLEKTRPMPEGVRTIQPVKSKEQETILGETCTWFDMWPGVMDAGKHECRTEDGLVLKERRYTRGSGLELVATRINRARVSLSDVSPAAMLGRSNWGLPE